MGTCKNYLEHDVSCLSRLLYRCVVYNFAPYGAHKSRKLDLLVGVTGDLIAHHHLLDKPLVARSRVVVSYAHRGQQAQVFILQIPRKLENRK